MTFLEFVALVENMREAQKKPTVTFAEADMIRGLERQVDKMVKQFMHGKRQGGLFEQLAKEDKRPDGPRPECPGDERGGTGPLCCDRAGEYNGFGSDGPLLFRCPQGCGCHD